MHVTFDSHDKHKYNTFSIKGGFVDIPYRCLVPKRVDGVVAAGRCVSTDHLANSAIRRMTSAFMTGQVAGLACAVSLPQDVPPRQVKIQKLVAMLQQQGVVTSQKYKSTSD